MSPRSDDEVDYLLSRGKLGGSQRQRILETALAASRAGMWARWRGRLAWSVGGLTLAAAAAAVLIVFRVPVGSEGFQVKGSGEAPLITVACLGAEVAACPPGSKLAVVLEGGRDKGGFLTAYADPTKPGERIWYLTNEPVAAPSAGSSQRVLPKAAVIDQPAGTYHVHAIFSRGPVVREALANLPAGEALARLDLDLVVPR